MCVQQFGICGDFPALWVGAGAGAFCAGISVWAHRTLPMFGLSVAVGKFRPECESPGGAVQMCAKQEVGADLHAASRILGLARLELCRLLCVLAQDFPLRCGTSSLTFVHSSDGCF